MKSHGEARATTVGRTAEYKIWTGILSRCTNHRVRAYARYGGRGIGVCTRWLKYENFLADMGRRPTPKHSIDRIDFNGPYTPSNCRWATVEQQARNKSNIRPLTIDGVSHPLVEWAHISGTPLKAIWERLAAGWLPSRAVFAPLKRGRPTHCKAGHLLTEETTRREGNSRRCVQCKKDYDAAYRKQAIERGLLPEQAEDEEDEE